MGIPQCYYFYANYANFTKCIALSQRFQKTILDDTHAKFTFIIEEKSNGVTTQIEGKADYVQFPDSNKCQGAVQPKVYFSQKMLFLSWEEGKKMMFYCGGKEGYFNTSTLATRFMRINATLTSSIDQKSVVLLEPVDVFESRINGIYIDLPFDFKMDLGGYTTQHDLGVKVDLLVSFLYNETWALKDGFPVSDYILYQFSIRTSPEISCFDNSYLKVYPDRLCLRYRTLNEKVCKHRTTSFFQILLFSYPGTDFTKKVMMG